MTPPGSSLESGTGENAMRGAMWLTVFAFCAFGIMWGACHVLLVDVQRALKLSNGVLGLSMTLGISASIPSMLLSGRMVDRYGAKAVMAVTVIMLAAALECFATATSLTEFCIALALLYGSSGGYDVAINAAAIHLEQGHSKRILAYFHGAFSAFAAASGAFCGYLLSEGIPFRTLYSGLAALLTLVCLMIAFNPVLSQVHRSAQIGKGERVDLRKIVMAPAILLVAAITTLSFLSENALQTWSSFYLRNYLGLGAVIGSVGPSASYAAMALGRFVSGYIINAFGRVTLLRLAGVLAAFAMSLALWSADPRWVIAGFVLGGLAQSGIAPAAYSIGGDVSPQHAGKVTSIITTIGYAGFLLGPALIGGLAQLFSLRIALGMVILAGGLITLLAFFLNEPRSAAAEAVSLAPG
jgi:MFS family permease